MKNKFKWSMVSIAIVASALTVVSTLKQNAEEYELKKSKAEDPNNYEIDHFKQVEKLTEEEMEEQTSEIGGVQNELGISSNSAQDEVIEVMHHMTHQKVISEDKWGAVEMNSENINAVYEIVKDSDFMLKDDLLRIVTGWKEGSFDNVAQDHNYFWKYQDGTVGRATGILNSNEEAEFVKNNF
ncbi:hypothetical protein J7E52_00090 [Bacillus sp. ISL-34]|uniref:DUF6241 domain-containing protein n=1 Tax=Bacillus sp. ISL-34 TaxID=2819121 RepID=UPI001BEC449C|nr:DUF6241 domain-containing protein [Bacillus sp. ISL-34]MBT2645132.1 hypothetical protein [Bacillus sp. ISL-34]